MPFIVRIDPPIELGKQIVIPISMSQGLQKGESLKSILDEIEKSGHKENTTILICDYLNRHNCEGEEQIALEQGQNFINRHNSMLEGFKIKRWKNFMDERREKFEETLKKIDELSETAPEFLNKMKKTHTKCKTATSLEASIKCQKEEYAAILCMDEFDELVYPKRATDGMSYLYRKIEGRKPNYNHIKITEKKLEEDQRNLLLFKPYSGVNNNFSNTKKNHMHLALRLLLDNAENLLNSPEISISSKKLFIDAMQNLIDSTIASIKELEKSEETKNSLQTLQTRKSTLN